MRTNKTLKSGLHALVWKEGDWYVAKCIEVEVASQGKSKSEAISNLEEALKLYFEDEKTHLPKGLTSLEILPISPKISYA
jgi:predicted RNase H-like HicB family nuclease